MSFLHGTYWSNLYETMMGFAWQRSHSKVGVHGDFLRDDPYSGSFGWDEQRGAHGCFTAQVDVVVLWWWWKHHGERAILQAECKANRWWLQRTMGSLWFTNFPSNGRKWEFKAPMFCSTLGASLKNSGCGYRFCRFPVELQDLIIYRWISKKINILQEK